ncbi:MAG: hypothetical protein OXG25_06580 [Gammaproteobacteria bacterium]|nr:hypothetical protein [Gammaproteobacteria bacterium]
MLNRLAAYWRGSAGAGSPENTPTWYHATPKLPGNDTEAAQAELVAAHLILPNESNDNRVENGIVLSPTYLMDFISSPQGLLISRM